MSLLYLLDTNIMSEPAQPKPDSNVVTSISAHFAEIALASVSIHELLYGLEILPDGKRKNRLEKFINQTIIGNIPILGYDEQAAKWHAEERARQKKAGTITPFVDGQIAAIAQVNHLTLVTGNEKDFRYFSGLTIENWYNIPNTST